MCMGLKRVGIKIQHPVHGPVACPVSLAPDYLHIGEICEAVCVQSSKNSLTLTFCFVFVDQVLHLAMVA